MPDQLDPTNTDATAPRRESPSEGAALRASWESGAYDSDRERQGRSRQVYRDRQPRGDAGATWPAYRLVDADLYGPSIPGMLGIPGGKPRR